MEKILGHRGTINKEFLVRWKGYDSDEDSWKKEQDVTQSAITEYRQYSRIKTRHTHNKDYHVKYQDDNIIDIDPDTLEHSMPDHKNESMNDNVQKVMSKAKHDAAQSQTARYTRRDLKQQDIPEGMRQVQNHSEKDLIMKATDIELQAFKDLDVYELQAFKDLDVIVSRKTIPRGAEDSNRAFYNLLKKTILSFTSTEKIKI